MPQPVHYSHHIHYEFTPKALLGRPKLAAHMAVVSAMWNEIEARIGALLAALVGAAEAETVISIFLAVKNDAARRATIDTVARLKMSDADRERFQEIMRIVGKRYDERNPIVHGAWGLSPSYPGAILWADIRETMMLHVRMMNAADDQGSEIRLAYQRKILAYNEADFLNIEKRFEETFGELAVFSKPIMEQAFGPRLKVDLPPTLLPPG